MISFQQQHFVDQYLIDMNGTQAAIRAGYSKNCAAEQAYRLLRKDQIRELISHKQNETANELRITRLDVVRALQAAYKIAHDLKKPQDMITACNEISKLIGLHNNIQQKSTDLKTDMHELLKLKTDAELKRTIETGRL